jgi:hypothetical protein
MSNRRVIDRETAIQNIATILRGRHLEEAFSVHDIYAGGPPALQADARPEHGRTAKDYGSRRKGK